MYKLIIAGGREFHFRKIAEEYLNWIINDKIYKITDEVEIISGGAKGADKIGEDYALEHSLTLKVFNADWDKYGKSAGYIRNEEMAKYAYGLVAFWDGKSRGTKHMIDLARKHNLDVWILQYND